MISQDLLSRWPEALRAAIGKREDVLADFSNRAAGTAFRRVMLIGAGDTLPGCELARPFIEFVTGIETTVTTPAITRHISLTDDIADMLIIACAGGTGVEDVRAAARVLESIGRFVVIADADQAPGAICLGSEGGALLMAALSPALIGCEYAYRRGQNQCLGFVAKGLISQASYVRLGEVFLTVADRMARNLDIAASCAVCLKRFTRIVHGEAAQGAALAAARALGAACAVSVDEALNAPHAQGLHIILDTPDYIEHPRLVRVWKRLREQGDEHLFITQTSGHGEHSGSVLILESCMDPAMMGFECLPALLRLCQNA